MNTFGNHTYNKEGEELPNAVKRWAGMKSFDGKLPVLKYENQFFHDSLMDLNDGGKNFNYIADIIEKNYKEL